MSAFNITASTQFATELVRAALPVVARRSRSLHGIWEHLKIKMREETPKDRVGDLVIKFHNGAEVSAQCKIFRDGKGMWHAGKACITLPNGSVWEVFGSLDAHYIIAFDHEKTRQLKH